MIDAPVGYFRMPKRLLDLEFLNRGAANFKSAWCDLWAWANDTARTIRIGSSDIVLSRGQLARSMVTLARDWNWDREKVKAFLTQLQNENLITFETSSVTTLITVLDYTVYNPDNMPDIEADSAAFPTAFPATLPASIPATIPTAFPAQNGERGKEERGKGKAPAAESTTIPDDSEVAAFCAEFRDLSRGVTSGIPEAWWAGWLAAQLKRDRFPRDWRRALTLDFRSDWMNRASAGHVKAHAEKKRAEDLGEFEGMTLPQRSMKIDQELRDVRARLDEAHDLDQPPRGEDVARLAVLEKNEKTRPRAMN